MVWRVALEFHQLGVCGPADPRFCDASIDQEKAWQQEPAGLESSGGLAGSHRIFCGRLCQSHTLAGGRSRRGHGLGGFGLRDSRRPLVIGLRSPAGELFSIGRRAARPFLPREVQMR